MSVPLPEVEQITSQHGGVEWYVHDHIIHAWVEGDWTNGSAQFFNEQFLKKIQESRADRVHIIFDTQNMKQVLVSPNATVKHLNYLKNEKVGVAILYGIPMPQRAMVGLLANVLNAAFDTKVELTKTETEAMELITRKWPETPTA